jgi:hypothetical protein
VPENGPNIPATPQPSPQPLELPTREKTPPSTALGRWFSSGGRLDEPQTVEGNSPWYAVMCLTGLDYFGSLAYQPGIALIGAGMLAPTATLLLVAVTVFGVLPVYAAVAKRSYVGQGSVAMLEHLFSGWRSKLVVLILLGFAATDFVLTITVSAADGARHAIENPYVHPYLAHSQFSLTILLLVALAIVFFIGFGEAIVVAVAAVVPFMLVNLVVLMAGLFKILRQPALISSWHQALLRQAPSHDWTGVLLGSAIVFPSLALGLSGFETGVSVMPLIDGGEEDKKSPVPLGRIRGTRKLLAAAAITMGLMLILSGFVTALLIPPSAYRVGGPASGRAIAYLAHQLLGNGFGTFYDISTIAMLWLGGASAMAGLVNLVPRYLPRFGMAPRWVAYRRPMVAALLVVSVLVTMAFHASVNGQADAFATGVLALILSAAVAVTISFAREFRSAPRANAWSLLWTALFAIVTIVFVYTFIANVIERPDGVIISSIFIVVILSFSALSRYARSKELRVAGMEFVDDASAELWPRLVGKKINLVPCHASTEAYRTRKAEEILRSFRVSGPLAFLHVNLLDNRSEFISRLRVSVRQEGQYYVIEVWGAVAIANTIAFITELIDPSSLFIVLSGRNLMAQSLRYLLWGEGEVGMLVYSILVHYWEWTGKMANRPPLFLTTA